MKNNRIYLVLVLICTVFILTGCAKSKADKCEELLNDVSSAATAFGSDISEATCIDYYQAINDYFDGCDNVPSSTRSTYQSWLDTYDCSIYAGY
jgi:hypothetical protein